MGKGKTFTGLTAGLFVALATSACGGTADDAADGMPADQTAAPVGTEPAAPASNTVPVTPASPTGEPQAGGDDAALVEQGRQAFATSVCVSCHGPTATGTALAPDLTDDVHLWVQPGPNAVAETAALIKTGVPTPKDPAHVAPMPPFGGIPLSDDQVNALAAYVVSLSM